MFKRLFWDDFCAIVAVATFLTSAILWKYNLFRVYLQKEASAGKRPFDQSILDSMDYMLHLFVPFNILFYSGLWAVKFSLLVFFQKLGNDLRSFRVWWWCVFAVTAVSYVGCIADIPWECTRPAKSFAYIVGECSVNTLLKAANVLANCDSPQKTAWFTKTLYANCSLDVGSDLLSKLLQCLRGR
jgi:hypothetical protein